MEPSGLDPSSIVPADPRDGLLYGMILTGKIVEILQSGVMLKIRPDMEPMLCPTSRLSIRPVSHPSELGFHLGHEIQVKYKGRDPESGLIE